MQTTWKPKFLALIIPLTLTFAALPALSDEQPPSEARVALVNGTVITENELSREVDRFSRQLAARGRPMDVSKMPQIRRGALESLINRELLYQESQKKGIKIEDATIDQQLDGLRGRFPDAETFKSEMEKLGFSEAALRTQMRQGMAIQQFIAQEVGRDVVVSDQDAKTYYDSNPDFFKKPEEVHASHILIKVDSQADEAQKATARKKIEEVQQKLQEGADFAALATEFSEGPTGERGGDLGFFSRGQMVKPFEDAVFALKPGEVSDIVETRFGYHLIKLAEKKPETTVGYEEVKTQIQERLKQQKIQEELQSYIAKLKAQAKVERFMTETP